MDIGAYIKATTGNAAAKSSSYKKQSKSEGSPRQLRGSVLKQMADGPKKRDQFLASNDPQFNIVVEQLVEEGLIHISLAKYYLGNR